MAGEFSHWKLSDFSCRVTLATRWNDVGGDGCIGHVEVARYYEDARVALTRQMFERAGRQLQHLKVFVARLGTEQFVPLSFPQELEMGACISRLGRSSYNITIAAFSNGSCVGASETVTVAVDERSRPMPIPEDHRQLLQGELLGGLPSIAGADKPAAERLLAENYPHSCELDTRFSDTDRLGHINNVAIVRYYDDALVSLLLECHGDGEPLPKGWPGLVRHADVSFSGESQHMQPLRIVSAVTAIEDDGIQVQQALFQSGECVGVRDATVVLPQIPDALRQRLTRLQRV